jgi:two-component system sensor histidine kinase DctS
LALIAVLLLLGRDIRRRLRVEQDLANALAFRKAMEDSLVTGLRARDLNGRITYVNPAFCQMVGVPARDLLNHSFPNPYWPPELAGVYQDRQTIRLASNSLPQSGFESVFMRSDGTLFPVLIIEAPLINANGKHTGWMSAILDISEQRRVEEMSRASQDRLQATARLAMVGEMASLLSHELNQPLAIILSNAQAAQRLLSAETPDLKELREILDDIVTADIRAADVIKRLRAILRRGEPILEPVAPAELFTKALQLTKAEIESAHVIVNQRHSQKLPVIPADRIPVEQVLVNLIKNACDAMANNGSRDKTITLSCINEGASLRFSIRDNGCGLPENADQIFEAFHSTKPNGLGLGLTICQTIIRAHGGRLWVEPNKSHGATFHFTLPY